MPEDKLTHDERLRLECLAQANLAGARAGMSPESVVRAAQEFEQYVRGEDEPG